MLQPEILYVHEVMLLKYWHLRCEMLIKYIFSPQCCFKQFDVGAVFFLWYEDTGKKT